MLTRFFGTTFGSFSFFLGASMLAVGLPTSKVLMSIGTMLLLLTIFVERDFKAYWRAIKSSVPFCLLAAYFCLHLVSLLWTTDFHYAFDDLRVKLPLVIIPFVFTVRPPSEKFVHTILALFLTTVLLISLYNFAAFVHWIGNRNYEDIREMSLFGSHIRFGILVAIATGVCLHFLVSLKSKWKWLLVLAVAWLAFYTYFSQIISGFLALSAVVILFVGLLIYHFPKWLRYSTVTVFCLFLLVLIVLIVPFNGTFQHTDASKLDKFTASGNRYTFNLNHVDYYRQSTFSYVCESELEREWDKRSKVPFYGFDKKGQLLRFTLIRYMASKNLRKDSLAFQQLSGDDIRSIESGIASINEKKIGLLARIDGIRFQFAHPENPNGHSLLQRLEYWKVAVRIIKKNWLIGVGVGDVQTAFDREYASSRSLLKSENRLRAHNSYLTSWLSFGLLGILLFSAMNITFFWRFWKTKSYLPLMFIAAAMTTFLIEDTLETQMGVTFFAFFFGLFGNRRS